MKRFGLLLLMVFVAAIAWADSNTVNPPPVPGTSSFASSTVTFLNNEDANRWGELGAPFQNFVSIVGSANACLGAPAAGLTMTPTPCVAYNAGYRSTETHSITFPNNSACEVAMDDNTSGSNPGLPHFTRYLNTHYLLDCIDVLNQPMTTNSQALMDVTTLGGAITAVSDLRATKAFTSSSAAITLSGDANGAANSNLVTSTHLSVPLPVAQGGSGGGTITAHNAVIAEGTSPLIGLPMPVDTFMQGQGAALDPTAGVLPACASDGMHGLTYAGHALACTTITAATVTHGKQIFTINGNFTVPANVFWLTIECWGGGGGGGGYGAGLGAPSAGGQTTVGAVCKANGGFPGTGVGVGSLGTGGLGGVIAGAAGTLILPGAPGFPGNVNIGTGGFGGGTPRGGGSGSISGTPPFGVGGDGGGTGTATTGAGGGGGGGYSELLNVGVTPGTVFAVTIGTAGAKGTGGTADGTDGAAGAAIFTW